MKNTPSRRTQKKKKEIKSRYSNIHHRPCPDHASQPVMLQSRPPVIPVAQQAPASVTQIRHPVHEGIPAQRLIRQTQTTHRPVLQPVGPFTATTSAQGHTTGATHPVHLPAYRQSTPDVPLDPMMMHHQPAKTAIPSEQSFCTRANGTDTQPSP